MLLIVVVVSVLTGGPAVVSNVGNLFTGRWADATSQKVAAIASHEIDESAAKYIENDGQEKSTITTNSR